MRRALSVGSVAVFAAFVPSSPRPALADADCWCSKNGKVTHVSQSNCDAIGGTCYKTKQQALANALTGLNNPDDFHAVSAGAATMAGSIDGYQYLKKFADWITNRVSGNPVGHALDTCESIPNTQLHCDIVFMVAADGRIQRMFFAWDNSYTQCVAKNFRTSGKAPRPQADFWAVQIRLVDGLRPRYKGGDPPFEIFGKSSR